MALNVIELRAFIAYYRELAEQARESREGLGGHLREVMTLQITIGDRGYPLVEVPIQVEQSRDFAQEMLMQLEGFCLRRAQELESKLPVGVRR